MRQAIHVLMEGGAAPPRSRGDRHGDAERARGARGPRSARLDPDLGSRCAERPRARREPVGWTACPRDLQALLRERFGIEHVTIQLESDRSPLIQVASRNAGSPDDPGDDRAGREQPSAARLTREHRTERSG
jgi:hypothetical protein